MLTLQALSSSLNAGTAKRAAWAEERLLGALRQSVPQNGRVICTLQNFCCDHTSPIQNTKPLRTPKYTPKYTPNPSPKPKYRKNTKNIRKSPNFVYFSYFFCISVLEEGFGVYFGVYFGVRRGFVFCMGDV